MINYIVGIDPGKEGAIATFDIESGCVAKIDVISMPVTEIGRTKAGNAQYGFDRISIRAFFDNLVYWSEGGEMLVVIEKASAMPNINDTKNGKKAPPKKPSQTLTIGIGYGLCLGAIPVTAKVFEPQPGKWKQKILSPLGVQADPKTKEASVEAMGRLYPHAVPLITGPRGGIDRDKAEAILIAHYGVVVAKENGLI